MNFLVVSASWDTVRANSRILAKVSTMAVQCSVFSVQCLEGSVFGDSGDGRGGGRRAVCGVSRAIIQELMRVFQVAVVRSKASLGARRLRRPRN